MKQKIIYMLVFVCCLSLFSSAKQVEMKCIKKCPAPKTQAVKEKPAKPKKITATGNARPFNFYLFNI